MLLSDKQKAFWNCANSRWNIKSGATRSGKTYLDYYIIPKRIRAVHGSDGLIVILGNTKSTLQRNIIEPLQGIWGDLVSDIKADNTATMFGERVHCIGADKASQVNRLRGASIKYCYGDEVVTWNEEVFSMLKSRLDKPYSRFDGTCNPESPGHWFKQFIDSSDLDIFLQNYTIYDNPFLDPDVVKNLENEYRGTVYFDRYILGKWVRAEGIIFPEFANNPERWLISAADVPHQFRAVTVGFDVGGNGSHHALTCIGDGYDNIQYVLKSIDVDPVGTNMLDIEKMVVDFCSEIEADYNCSIDSISCDWVDVVINSINDNTPYRCFKCYKPPLDDRPLTLSRLFNTNKIKFVANKCDDLIDELKNVIYDKKQDRAVICDDGSMCIDCVDSMVYAFRAWNYLTM